MLIRNAVAVLPDRLLSGCNILCRGGKIVAVGPGVGGRCDRVVDAGGRYVSPGFLDLHIHGTLGLLAERGPEELGALSKALPRFGVTGFLPAVCPGGSQTEDEALLSALAGCAYDGAEVLGLLLEGHFLALAGAISGEVQPFGRERVDRLRAACAPLPAVFAVSPELPGAVELLPVMTAGGIPAFLTHTQANGRATERAIAAGATHATHFYNVFPYPGDREPGVRSCGAVEAVLASPSVTVDFILDGEHVDPLAVRMALACKGPGAVSLVTDANTCAGMPPGRYAGLCGYDVVMEYPSGPARCAGDGPVPGTLAGSGLTMDRAVMNAVLLLGASLPLAVRMATANPAAVLGLAGRKGTLAAGFDADLVLFDEALHVRMCWVGGKLCHEGE